MTRRRARKADTPPALPVPRVRAVIGDADGETTTVCAPPRRASKPRKRKARFVF